MYTTIRLFQVSLVLSLCSCLLLCAGAVGDDGDCDRDLTRALDDDLRVLGGEQLVIDAHYIVGLRRSGRSDEMDGIERVEGCLGHYLAARELEHAREIDGSQRSFLSCVEFCQAADRRTDRFREFTSRYIAECRFALHRSVGAGLHASVGNKLRSETS